MRPERVLLVFALAAILLARPARANDTSPQPLPAATPAFLSLVVNGVRQLPVRVLLVPGDAFVSPEDLAAAGLRVKGGVFRDDGGRARVALRSVAPRLAFTVDELNLELRIVAGPEALAPRALDLRPSARPADLETAGAPAAYLDYYVRETTTGELSVAGELGASGDGWLATTGFSRAPDGAVVRGLSTVTWEDPGKLLRASGGDVVIGPEPLAGSPIVTGIAIGRDPSLDPYLVTAPLPAASIFARAPSTLEVWVNGALQRSIPVSPGTYDLTQLPVTTGSNDVQLVLRDAFGRVEAVNASHYQAQALLAPGLATWSAAVGWIRQGFGTKSFDLGDPVAVARGRRGLTDWLTGGARLEVTPELASGGLTAVFALPIGEAQLAASASVRDGEPGGAALAAWRTTVRRSSLGVDASWTSPAYAIAGASPAASQVRWRVGATGASTLGPVASVQLRLGLDRAAGPALEPRADALAFLRLGRGIFVQLGAGVGRRDGGGTDVTGLVAITVAADPRTSAGASAQAGPGTFRSQASVQRPLPVGDGFGYDLRVDGDPRVASEGQLTARAQAQARFGRLEGEYTRTASDEAGALAASGTLQLLGGELFATRPRQGSSALVQVPGVPGVRVALENQPVGRTDAEGNLLVPGLLAHYGNRLSIADADVPLRYTVGRTTRFIAPATNGAAVVRFDVQPLRAITGRLLLTGPFEAVPAFGTLRMSVGESELSSPLGDDGSFWIEGAPAGTHPAWITWRGVTCSLALVVPAEAPDVVANLGEVACLVQEHIAMPSDAAPAPTPLVQKLHVANPALYHALMPPDPDRAPASQDGGGAMPEPAVDDGAALHELEPAISPPAPARVPASGGATTPAPATDADPALHDTSREAPASAP